MEYSELKEGDLIRALITDEKINKKNREHCFIIFNPHQIKDDSKKRHRICIPACSFSSKFPKSDNEIYIEIDPNLIPIELFNDRKENTILRIGKPKCVEKYQFREYKTNLKAFPHLWKEICEKVFKSFPEDLGILNSVCDCDCLVNNKIDAGYCEQDIPYLYDQNSNKICEKIKLCSCCRYKFDTFNYYFEDCPKCKDNTHIIIIGKDGNNCCIYKGTSCYNGI